MADAEASGTRTGGAGGTGNADGGHEGGGRVRGGDSGHSEGPGVGAAADAVTETRDTGTGAGTGAGATALRSRVKSSYLKDVRPLGVNELPWHEAVGERQTSQPSLDEFAAKALEEAATWNKPETTWTKDKDRYSDKSKAVKIECFSKSEGTDKWFLRSSIHHDVSPSTWEQFKTVLKDDHSKNEKDYTPELFWYQSVLKWDLGRSEYADALARLKEKGWEDVTLEIVEMYHNVGALLNFRAFNNLVLTASRKFPSGEPRTYADFIVVQLPIDSATFPEDFLDIHSAIKQHRFQPPRTGTGSQPKENGKAVTKGVYASVERVARFSPKDPERGRSSGTQINWTMSTTSNAKGVLPVGLQNQFIPSTIAKDVKFVLDFLKSRE